MKSLLPLAVLTSLLIGSGATYAVMKPKPESDANPHGSMTHNMSDMSMSAVNDELKTLTGDEFDKAFTAMMIEHHQGAIDMANTAKTNAKHDEIKTMVGEIISAQSREIEQMKRWQIEWGY